MSHTYVKIGMQFKDRDGSMLEVHSKAPGVNQWWCKGVPDVIGLWMYDVSTIKKGLIK